MRVDKTIFIYENYIYSERGESKMNDSQKMKWYTLAFMCFSTLWGFGNVLNGFMYFNGIQVIFSWILMFALYFVPYALMVGELGSAFKNSGGGVSSWIHETTGPKAAYYAGWTYWACHITYIASKGSGGLKALSWMIFQNSETYASFNTKAVQFATLAVLLLFSYVASRGLNHIDKWESKYAYIPSHEMHAKSPYAQYSTEQYLVFDCRAHDLSEVEAQEMSLFP